MSQTVDEAKNYTIPTPGLSSAALAKEEGKTSRAAQADLFTSEMER